MSLLELFIDVDDFWQVFHPIWKQQMLSSGNIHRVRQTQLSMSEIMTIIIHFHQSSYRNFKAYYIEYVQKHLWSEFPDLVSYNRFVELMPRALIPLLAYLRGRKGTCTGISFIDSTPLIACHNRRIQRHKVFSGLADRGKTSMGWFYGFKLHLVVNELGEILAFQLTPGNVDDRKPVPKMSEKLFGKLFGDRGYISKKLFLELYEQGLMLITTLRKNMKNQLMCWDDKLLLRKRSIIETINDQLKNISQIEHTRHRSYPNFIVNLLAGLIAYTFQPKKPAINFSHQHIQALSSV
jgi:transposase